MAKQPHIQHVLLIDCSTCQNTRVLKRRTEQDLLDSFDMDILALARSKDGLSALLLMIVCMKTLLVIIFRLNCDPNSEISHCKSGGYIQMTYKSQNNLIFISVLQFSKDDADCLFRATVGSRRWLSWNVMNALVYSTGSCLARYLEGREVNEQLLVGGCNYN